MERESGRPAWTCKLVSQLGGRKLCKIIRRNFANAHLEKDRAYDSFFDIIRSPCEQSKDDEGLVTNDRILGTLGLSGHRTLTPSGRKTRARRFALGPVGCASGRALTFFSVSSHLLMAMVEEPVRSLSAMMASLIKARVDMLTGRWVAVV